MSTVAPKSLVLALALALGACVSSPGDAGEAKPDQRASLVTELARFSQCPVQLAGERVMLFDSAADWSRHAAGMGKDQAARLPSTANQTNWSEHAVVMITIGQRNSAGHGFELNPGSRIVDRELQLHIAPFAPASGSMNAMVITYPCAYYQVKSQAFDRLAVRSGNNTGKGLVLKRAP
jgi:hypothetical protein